MRIAITSDPELPIPPTFYGGIERIIDGLIRGLIEDGHDITLFAHRDSKVQCHLVPYPNKKLQRNLEIIQIGWSIGKEVIGKNYDVIHSFGRLAYLLPLLPLRIPKVMSYQRQPTLSAVKRAMFLAQKNTLVFTGCSEFIASQLRPYAPITAIHNFVPIDRYGLQIDVENEAPLVFLGRIEYIKGPHLAIQIAKITGRRLIIAGNIPNDEASKIFFSQEIEPFINQDNIRYIGPVNDVQKNIILGSAAALLMPILWDEPFGIVMVEALACGTPVIALNRGAVPEIITQGLNGYYGENILELCEAVNNIHQISRIACRQSVEENFSSEVIVRKYKSLYLELC